ncbi:MAG: hypothetical protein GF307_10250 [candidate division Zixibacteria bacterium]|nr:hypothetical protein [candidate division Zixibacteria bacterium]
MLAGSIRILRPVNGLISSLTVWISFIISGGGYAEYSGILASIAAFFFAGFANSVNDIEDIDIDRINKPHRPLPSGRINKKTAIMVAILSGLIALGISFILTVFTAIIGIIAVAGMLLYNLRLKRIAFWGNTTVSLIAAVAFIYGGAANNNIFPALFPALMAFLLHLGREVTKDIEDVRGDSAVGARTLPLVRGLALTRNVASIPLMILIPVTLLPMYFDMYSYAYLIMVTPVNIILLLVIYNLLISRRLSAKRNSLLLKVAMPLGIMAILFGTIIP